MVYLFVMSSRFIIIKVYYLLNSIQFCGISFYFFLLDISVKYLIIS